jgi:hypothetical protein
MINLGFNTSPPATEGIVNWEGVTPGAQPLTMIIPASNKLLNTLIILPFIAIPLSLPA